MIRLAGGRGLAGVLSLSAALILLPLGVCRAQEGSCEVFAVFQSLRGDSTTYFGRILGGELDDTVLYGVGFGYAVSPYLNVNTELLFGGSDLALSVLGTPIGSVGTDIFACNFNLDWNVLAYPVTPIFTGGVGLMTFTDLDETDLSYNVGAGVRWVVAENVLVKATYRLMWMKLKSTHDALLLDGFNLSIGVTF